MATTATVTLKTMRAEVNQLEGEISREKQKLSDAEHELDALKVERGAVDTAKVGAVITKIGVQEEIIRRLRGGIRAKEPRIIELWGRIRSEEAAERTNAPLREIESLKAKGEAIVSNLEAKLSRAIGDDLAEYRRVREQLAVHVNTAHMGVFPIPPADSGRECRTEGAERKTYPDGCKTPRRVFSDAVTMEPRTANELASVAWQQELSQLELVFADTEQAEDPSGQSRFAFDESARPSIVTRNEE